VTDAQASAKPRDLRAAVGQYLPVVIQLVGLASVSVGLALLALWAGLVAAGVGLMVFGTATELQRSGGR
jgi:CHASE2 domain-containing sensor protein